MIRSLRNDKVVLLQGPDGYMCIKWEHLDEAIKSLQKAKELGKPYENNIPDSIGNRPQGVG